MFSKVIGKKCTDSKCKLAGQLQDTGFVICPECGGDLVQEIVEDKRARAIVMGVAVLIGLSGGLFGYGLLAKRLNPLLTIKWVLGRIQLNNSFRPAEAKEWIDGRAVFYGQSGQLAQERDTFLYQQKSGKRTSTFRGQLEPGTKMKFDITPAVPHVYVVYESGDDGQVLSSEKSGNSISFPANANLIQLNGGAATEHFVLVAAKAPVAALDGLRGQTKIASKEIDAIVGPLEINPEAYVLHIQIPHK